MSRRKLRPQGEVIDRCRSLRTEVTAAFAQLPSGDPGVIEAIWRGEALGTLLWALQLAELPPYDEAFATEDVVGIDPTDGALRDVEEVSLERESARLWHWRARTTTVQTRTGVELPPQYENFDQLIAATAMRGYEDGLLPAPLRGDFPAFGNVYRHLTPGEHSEALSIALERHQALGWLTSDESWDDVPLDT